MDCEEHSFININDYLMCQKCYFIQYIKVSNKNDCCDNKYIIENNCYLVCQNCGLIDKFLYSNSNEVNSILYFKSTLFYKRKKYIKRKLELMTEKITIEDHSEFMKIINICKENNIEEHQPNKIINVLQKHKLTKYKKYYYYIYYVLFDKKLINLTSKNKTDIINLFMQFEKKLKEYNIKYLNSYNLILRIIMKQLGIESYEHILLPKSCSKNVDIYELILKTI